MNIGINLFQLLPGKIGGMEQFIHGLIESILSLTDYKIYLFLNKYSYSNLYINNKQVKKIKINATTPDKLDTELHTRINELNIDLWFCPLFTLTPKNITIPSIVLIPDIQHEFFPHFFHKEELDLRKSGVHHSITEADAILTISRFSRNTIINNYKIPEDKIYTIYGDASPDFIVIDNKKTKDSIIQKYQLPEKYGLYPANMWPHKNHINLLKALVILRDTYKVKKQLIFTGYKHAHIKNYKIIRNFITNEKLDNQVKILGYIPQEDMPYIYSNAHFLVYPSLFEGFGIPLIEAMRTNIPIVCSNAGSIPEIVEESALIFNPYDPENIAIKMLEISQTEKRKELIEKGKIQAQKFSWKNSAEQTLVLFHQLLHKR